GEDARAGRIYLPLEWIDEAGLDVNTFLCSHEPSLATRRMTSRLLAEAHRLYLRSEAGIPALPRDARTGIYAARFIYDGIGKQVRRAGFNNITRRAHTSKAQKFGWVGRAILRTGFSMVTPRSPVLHARPLNEVAFLVDAASRQSRPVGRTAALLDVLAQLRQREAEHE
ncbi:squalene/phytoene synthase family protein, partial [Octadecabacter sp.]|nr:squalene/phytoene synthase family protein [Octadecabacter sp.]